MRKYIVLTEEQLDNTIEKAVTRTLVNLNLKPGKTQARVYRQEMITALGSRSIYERAVREGHLKVRKNGGATSKVWAKREDWEYYLKKHLTRAI